MTEKKIFYTASYRRNYIAFLAVLLFFIIIIGEVLLATAIPVLMRREDLMSAQAQRNELLQFYDHTRRVCNLISEKKAKQEDVSMILLEKQLLSDALGRFSRYMREEGENLTPEEVRRIRSVLNDIYKVAFELFNGKSYSRENRINTSKYINALLKQNNGKNPNAGKTL